jgi:uncharacterized circularly permuted ATP-grasp superfamily protein
MALGSKVNSLEKKLNISPKEMVVVFSQSGRCLLKRDGKGEVNKIFESIEEIKEFYKDRNYIMINVANIWDIDEELKTTISNNIEAIVINNDEKYDYGNEIKKIVGKAKEKMKELDEQENSQTSRPAYLISESQT